MSLNIVVGLSGVGKGTVLEEAMLLSEQDYEVVNYGDKMMEIARDHGVDSRDEMKKLEVDLYKQIQREAAEKIFEIADEENVIVDTHAAIKSPHGYIPGLPKWSIEEMAPDKIIMLTARPEEVWSRVKNDDRDREHGSPSSIAEYQHVAREMAISGSVLTGAYFKVIENPEGKAEQAAEKLLEALKA